MTPTRCPNSGDSGREVYYGDATLPEFLRTCGVMDAKAVIVTVAAGGAIDEVVRQVRALRSDIVIVSRARDAAHARHLYHDRRHRRRARNHRGQPAIVGSALDRPGQATGLVIASIHERRDEFRHELQQAAGLTSDEPSNSVQAENTSTA